MMFTSFACGVSRWAGRPGAFLFAVGIVIVWACVGPWTGYSDAWQLTINTGTTIVTFWMVFLIQATQNRDGTALQAKLDELIRVGRARNDFIGIDQKPIEEIEAKRETR